jgi:hypothetical protein
LTTLGLHLRILPAFDSQDAEFWSWPNSQLTLNFFYNISTLRRWAPVLLDRCACIFGDDFVKNKIRLLSANNWNQLQEFWFFFRMRFLHMAPLRFVWRSTLPSTGMGNAVSSCPRPLGNRHWCDMGI